ncbi:MAG: dihydroorotate dehydrogenase electron transfer subunit [Nitrospirae bacterium]|nr:dihydroorotate dehydrogenase electron transfer subunit [Nitrospirota bacterium]
MKAQVFSNKCIKGPYFKLVIKPSQKLTYMTGQFVMLRPAETTSAGIFLPRPFSIHGISGDDHIEILYKVVGKGTEFLSRLYEGSEIEFLGPFGNGFQIDIYNKPDEFIIVAGGIGVAPLLGLTQLIKSNCKETPVKVFIGGRGIMDLLCVEDFENHGANVVVATQDGSEGVKGFVTDALEEYLQDIGPDGRIILYACGPNAMLKRIYGIAGRSNIETTFSLEAEMACGMGLCMGCAVKKSGGGYYLVCKDGPVFNGDLIEFSND